MNACTDPLVNPDCTQKVGHPDLLSSVIRQSQKYLCALSLKPADLQSPNLHCGCTWHGCRVTWALAYFSWSRGQNVLITLWDNHGGTSQNCTEPCNLAHIAVDPLANPNRTSKIGHQSLWPTFLVQIASQIKLGVNRHFQASWASQPMSCLLCLRDWRVSNA